MSEAAYSYSYGEMKRFFKNPAEVAGKVCQQLAASETGLTPKALVDASRDENAPLHNEFEWDDNIAAEKYRESQASNIIRHLIIIRTDNQEIRKYKDRSFVSTGEQNNAYIPLKEALNNETWKANLLKAARQDAEIFIAKYRRLSELAGVIIELRRFLDEEAS